MARLLANMEVPLARGSPLQRTSLRQLLPHLFRGPSWWKWQSVHYPKVSVHVRNLDWPLRGYYYLSHWNLSTFKWKLIELHIGYFKEFLKIQLQRQWYNIPILGMVCTVYPFWVWYDSCIKKIDSSIWGESRPKENDLFSAAMRHWIQENEIGNREGWVR